jgi:glutaredoxin-like protein NrdH
MMVKLYALTTCPWCKKVKALLNEEGISYEVFDVDMMMGQEQEDALAEVEKLTGKRAFPVTVINDLVIQGYKPEELREATKNEK